MKILLVGKNGQLGRELNNQLSQTTHTVVSAGREEVDITDKLAVEKIIQHHKPEIVINASAFNNTSLAEDEPGKAFEVNTYAIQNLAKSSNKAGAQFVTFSTDYVFNGSKQNTYSEDDLPSPIQMYGISKVAGEYAAASYNPQSVIIRTCGVYGGTEGSSVKGNFVLNILKKAKEQQEIEVVDDQIVTPTYAVDLASATIALLEKKAEQGIYHLINEGHCSWAEFALEIIRLSNMSVTIKSVSMKDMKVTVPRPLYSVLANNKAKSMGIQLPTWQDAVSRYMQFIYS